MTWWFGISPIKLRPVAHQRPERRPSRIRSFPHGRRTVKLGWKENSFRIRVEQDLLRIEAVNTRQILSRHRVRIVAALANICDRNPAVPDVSGLVPQEVEAVDECRNHHFGRSVEQQRHAFRVLCADGEIEGLLLLHPSGPQRQRAALDLFPGSSFHRLAVGDRPRAIERRP